MSDRIAEEYIQLLAGDEKAQLALLACSAAFHLDDKVAREAIRLVAKSNGSTDRLLSRIKRLGCIWRQGDEWCVAEDVRYSFVNLLYDFVREPAVLSQLHEQLAAYADEQISQEQSPHRVYRAKFEAAIYRLMLPEKAGKGAAQLADLWQKNFPGTIADATADSVAYITKEIERHHQSFPAEVLFLCGMSARARKDRRAQERYFGEVYRQGQKGRIYALAAFFYARIVRNLRVAENAFRKCIEWDDSVRNRVIAYHELGNLLSKSRNRWKAAEEAYLKSLKLDPDLRSQAQTLHSLGDLLSEQGKWEEAKKKYEESLKLRTDKPHQGQVYHSLGNLFSKRPEYWEEAKKKYEESLKLFNDKTHQGRVYHSLGNLLSKRREYWSQAEMAYQKSIDFLEQNSDKGQVYHSRGKLLAQQPLRWSDAERDFWRSIDLRNNPLYQAYVFHSLGNLLSEQPKRLREACDAFRRSLELRYEPWDKIHVLASWTKVLSKYGQSEDYREAEDFARDNINNAKENKTKEIYYDFLVNIYQNQGKIDQAIEALESQIEIKRKGKNSTEASLKSKLARLHEAKQKQG